MKRALVILLSLVILQACSTASRRSVRTGQGDGETALQADPSPLATSDLYLGVVEGLIKQRRYEAAIAFLAKYQKSQPPTVRFRKLTADALLGTGRYEEAIATYKTILPSGFAAEAFNGIGWAQSANGHWSLAEENLRHATLLDPANALYLNNLGYARLKQSHAGQDLTPAVNALQRAYELTPDSGQIRNNLALATALCGNRPQLLTLLDTIHDANQRKIVSDFAARWTPGSQEPGVSKGGMP
jgi:Flp pilus assembly protein TadD